ncbi:MAG: VCBS repeat-containing protein [Verrucomicrobia bacterium]|nr:VCBS repeat-containing protein [Verrucomicrobiota bacterium]
MMFASFLASIVLAVLAEETAVQTTTVRQQPDRIFGSAAATAHHRGAPWTRHEIDSSSRGADGVRMADANGDGFLDIATGWEEGGMVRVYLNPGPTRAHQRWPSVTVGNVRSAEDAVLVDLDSDGAMDVVSSCEGKTKTMFVHWAPEAGKYSNPGSWTTEPLPASQGAMQ